MMDHEKKNVLLGILDGKKAVLILEDGESFYLEGHNLKGSSELVGMIEAARIMTRVRWSKGIKPDAAQPSSAVTPETATDVHSCQRPDCTGRRCPNVQQNAVKGD